MCRLYSAAPPLQLFFKPTTGGSCRLVTTAAAQPTAHAAATAPYPTAAAGTSQHAPTAAATTSPRRRATPRKRTICWPSRTCRYPSRGPRSATSSSPPTSPSTPPASPSRWRTATRRATTFSCCSQSRTQRCGGVAHTGLSLLAPASTHVLWSGQRVTGVHTLTLRSVRLHLSCAASQHRLPHPLARITPLRDRSRALKMRR